MMTGSLFVIIMHNIASVQSTFPRDSSDNCFGFALEDSWNRGRKVKEYNNMMNFDNLHMPFAVIAFFALGIERVRLC